MWRIAWLVALGALPALSSSAEVAWDDASVPEGPWDVVLGRRPYVSEATAELLLHLEPSTAGQAVRVAARLPCLNRSWAWDLTGGVDQVLDLGSLAGFPHLLNNDIIVEASIGGSLAGEIRRRFMRAFKPDPAQTVQVDHHTGGLLVDGKPFAGAGWYLYAFSAYLNRDLKKDCDLPTLGGPELEDPLPPERYDQLWDCVRWAMGNATSNLTSMARQGVNMVMMYQLNPFEKHFPMPKDLGPSRNRTALAIDLVLKYMDAAHASGVKVMFDMSKMDINEPCCHGPDFHPGLVDTIRRSVEMVRNHPALLGYHICDDCCNSKDAISTQARVYNTIKELDPYHITSGAVFLGCIAPFNDVPSRLPPTSDDGVQVLPGLRHNASGTGLEGPQPKTQLSVDFLLVENYDPAPDPHLKGDDRLRREVRFEAVANCDGSFTMEERIRRHKPPKLLETMMWASVVTANVANQLVFVNAYPEAIAGVLGNHWPSKASPMLFSSVALYRAKLQVLLPSLYAPFGLPQPTAAVTNQSLLLSAMHGMPHGSRIVARAWRQPRPSGWCGHLVVVSGVEQSAALFTVQLGGSFPVGVANQTALRLFDADYKVRIAEDGSFTDWIGPADTNIYQLGTCDAPRVPELPTAVPIIV